MHIYFKLGLKALGDFIVELIYFPMWWYSIGFLDLLKKQLNFLHNQERSMAFFVWIKNIGRPMYGQYNFWGYFISFFVRLFQILVRGSYLLVISVLSLTIIIAWILLPIISSKGIIFQLSSNV